MRKSTRLRFLFALLAVLMSPRGGEASGIQFAELGIYVHADGALLTQFDGSSSNYTSSLGPDNLGSFEWTFTNLTGQTLANVSVLGFLDADIDRDTTTFFNEFGELIALSLPPGTPGGAIGASTWEIDEPGFVFGDIITHLQLNLLDNANGVPSGSPDDVSMALGFFLGALAPGDSFHVSFQTSTLPISGLRQTDRDADSSFFYNGYATVARNPRPVPEPGLTALLGAGLLAAGNELRRKRRRLSSN